MSLYRLAFYNHDTNQEEYQENEIQNPRICSHCNNTGEQTPIDGILMKSHNDLAAGIIFTGCPLCGATSMHYLQSFRKGIGTELFYEVSQSFPKKYKNVEIPKAIQDKFPDFIEIFNQAKSAEEANLDQLAGMGYRKAIEFLVTDYLLKYPAEGVEEKWLTSPKTSLISKIGKLKNERIKQLATAITYLGNDETHYARRHPEYDLAKMKAFIHVLLSDIDNELIYEESFELINK